MTTTPHNLLRWLIMAVLLAIAGPSLALTASTALADGYIYDAVNHQYDAVATMGPNHQNEGLPQGGYGLGDVYDAVLHLFTGAVEARPETGWRNASKGADRTVTVSRSRHPQSAGHIEDAQAAGVWIRH